jgi:uncharacterized protein (TIGR00255 family)
MLQSMTGYGKEVLQLPSKKITVEIKSLNSKQLDLNVRMPQYYRSKEMEVRKMVAASAVRGKIDFSMYAEITGVDEAASINVELAKGYLNQLKTLAADADVTGDLISAVMRMPEVLRNEKEEIDEEEWNQISQAINSALSAFGSFRIEEGKSLFTDFNDQVNRIERLLGDVAQFESERVEKLRARIENQLKGLEEGFDPNRLEQEMIFYLEKLDVNEEKVRLTNHIDYFKQNLEKEAGGKKLGFIAQEMGREINTLGSKANHAEIQKIVVQMKEALEKIKEQVLNTL